MTTGLRERRKQEARQAISGIAMEMFAARGFDEVTISQVADAAGVSKMTVTNYFPRKENLVFDRAEVIIRSLADAAAARAPGESCSRRSAVTTPSGSPRATSPRPAPRRSPGWSATGMATSRGGDQDMRAGPRRQDRAKPDEEHAAVNRGGPARVGSPGAIRGRRQAHPGRPAARRDLPGARGGRPPGL